MNEFTSSVSDRNRGLCRWSALLFWAAIVTLSIIASVILSCAGGASKDKASTTDTYGTTCAGCGAGCGG